MSNEELELVKVIATEAYKGVIIKSCGLAKIV